MNNSHFRSGRSTFICSVCGRRTRDAGQALSSECCLECFELAGLDNTVNDGCAALGEVIAERDALVARAMARGGNEGRIRGEFSFLFPAA